jgi:ComF family protein
MQAEFFCVSCRTPFLNRHPLDEEGKCPLCRLGLSGFDAVYSFGSYEGALRSLIHLLKYEKVYPLARPLGRMLAQAIPREAQFDAVVPMPLHWRRRWQRGFNQSGLLAEIIARQWSVPVVAAVRRVKATAPQAGLTNSKRRLNMSGAFSARPSWLREFLRKRLSFPSNISLKGARVLLIDDVLTTGATAAACARALKRAGAKHVTLAAVARTDRRVALADFNDGPGAATARSRATAGGRTT